MSDLLADRHDGLAGRRTRTGDRARRKTPFRRPTARRSKSPRRCTPAASCSTARKANCVKCHGPTGLGDGQQDDYDNWSKANNEVHRRHGRAWPTTIAAHEAGAWRSSRATSATQREAELDADEQRASTSGEELIAHIAAAAQRDPAQPARRHVTAAAAGRSILFWRMSAGIAGTPMPAGGPAAPGAQGTLTATRNLADCRLRPVVAVRTGQPAAEDGR